MNESLSRAACAHDEQRGDLPGVEQNERDDAEAIAPPHQGDSLSEGRRCGVRKPLLEREAALGEAGAARSRPGDQRWATSRAKVIAKCTAHEVGFPADDRVGEALGGARTSASGRFGASCDDRGAERVLWRMPSSVESVCAGSIGWRCTSEPDCAYVARVAKMGEELVSKGRRGDPMRRVSWFVAGSYPFDDRQFSSEKRPSPARMLREIRVYGPGCGRGGLLYCDLRARIRRSGIAVGSSATAADDSQDAAEIQRGPLHQLQRGDCGNRLKCPTRPPGKLTAYALGWTNRCVASLLATGTDTGSTKARPGTIRSGHSRGIPQLGYWDC
jgi:hypothetical protein